VEKPTFLIAVSKAGDGAITAPPFNVCHQPDSDQATRLRRLFVLETWIARDSKQGRDRFSLGPRHGGGGRRHPCNPLLREPITMIMIGVLLNIVGLGFFCWVLFRLAVHALPFFAGVTVGIYSIQVGAGPFGAIVIGFAAAGLTVAAGPHAFSVARSSFVLLVIALLFAVPATRAGYDVTAAFAHIGVPSEWWPKVFALDAVITVDGPPRRAWR